MNIYQFCRFRLLEIDLKLVLSQQKSRIAEKYKLIDVVNKQSEKLDYFEQKLSEICLRLFCINKENNLLCNYLNFLTRRVKSLEVNRSIPKEDTFSDLY